jgi:hypothetical protein
MDETVRLPNYCNKIYGGIKPSFAVESSALLLNIWEVPSSNLGQQTGFPECSLLWFSSVTPGKFQDNTSNQNRFCPHQ